MLSRNVTNRINWVFDNLIPPAVRDSRLFMSIWFGILFGDKSAYFMKFKEIAPFLTKEEFSEYYRMLASKHIQRETDLSRNSVDRILENIVGVSVLDVGSGRGFLVRRIAEVSRISVVGIDMSIPEQLRDTSLETYLIGDIENLPFADNSFDTVTCCHTLEHVQNLERAIGELRRVARQRLIVVVPRQREYTYTFDLHLHFFPYLSSLKKVFKNEQAEYFVIDNDLMYVEDRLNPDNKQPGGCQ